MTSMMLDRVGRRWTQAVMYTNAAVSCLFLAFTPQGPTSLVVVFIAAWARISVIGASGATVVVTPELYPTEVRVPGHVVAATMSRVGTVICPYIAQNKSFGVQEVGLIFGLFNFCAVMLSLSLPETMGCSVEEAIDVSINGKKGKVLELTSQHNIMCASDPTEPVADIEESY
jgi:MFS family permease